MAKREILVPEYQPNRRVKFWFVEYDQPTDSARIGYDLVGMPDSNTRVQLGETSYSFEEGLQELNPSLRNLAQTKLASLRQSGDDSGEAEIE